MGNSINTWVIWLVLVIIGVIIGSLIPNSLLLAPVENQDVEFEKRAVLDSDLLRLRTQALQARAQQGGMEFSYAGETYDLALEESPSLYPDGRKTKGVKHFRGRVRGEPDSSVRASFTTRGLVGHIRIGQEWIFIEPNTEKSQNGFLTSQTDFLGKTYHSVYTQNDLNPNTIYNDLILNENFEVVGSEGVSLQPPSLAPGCNDPDGKNEFERGTTTFKVGTGGSSSRTDQCSGSQSVKEYICVNDRLGSVNIDCGDLSCVNGACKNAPTPPTCTPNCNNKQCGNDGCGGSCGTCDAGLSCNAAGQCETDNSDGGSRNGLRVIELAIDSDFDYFKIYGDQTKTEIESIINAVNGIYEPQLGITLQIVDLHINQNVFDHHTSSNPVILLQEFYIYYQQSKSNTPRDLAHLFTGMELNGNVIGIAFLNAVCTTIGYGISQDFGHPALMPILTAHEIGHNAGSFHDTCVEFGIDPETGEEKCIDYGTFIMAPGLKLESQPVFSESSKDQIETFISAVENFCVDTIGDPQDPSDPNPPEPPTCTPNCASKQCGSDGCGGSCGACDAGEICNVAQQCERESLCFDSDGGKNYNIVGTATDRDESKTDKCFIFGYLNEYYCDGDNVKKSLHRCPRGCSDGACR